MKAKYRRVWYLVTGGMIIAGFLVIVLFALKDQILYFMTPSDLLQQQAQGQDMSRNLSLGGVVCKNSIVHDESTHTYTFLVTDNHKTIKVVYMGIAPDLFKEGQAVVAQGALVNGVFKAKRILAKHDENYMPAAVAKKLQTSSMAPKPTAECYK